MKSAAFEYIQAQSATHAVDLLAASDPPVKLIAGGQSLGPMLNLRLATPATLVDIRACGDLRFCVDEGESVVYGAAITHAEFEDGALPDVLDGALSRVAARIAYRAVRNRGTIGGSLAHADPAADWVNVLLTLDAEAIVRGPEGMRAIKLQDFVTGPFSTRLRDSDVLVGVRLRKRAGGARFGYCKLSLKEGEFAHAFATALMDEEAGEYRLTVSAIERKPVSIGDEAAKALLAHVPSLETCVALIGEWVPGLAPAPRQQHAAALRRALRQALGAQTAQETPG